MEHWFSYGYRSATEAATALNNAISDGELSECERPYVAHYLVTKEGKPVARYGIRVHN